MASSETQTIKLVVIGDSGVGKTSLRGQVSPHFRGQRADASLVTIALKRLV
jgi:GTPase SAR1 family protein